MRIPRLHLISSRQHCPLEHFPGVAARAAAGGVDAIHVREPDLPDDDVLDVARRTQAALFGTGCRLFINARLAVAVKAGADGVQLPERGPKVADAREIVPAGVVVGVSVHSVESAIRAERDGADYLIAGHVFETCSKPGQAGRGVPFIEDVVAAVRLPVIAIGGMTPENVPDVVDAGALGVAVLSGILVANDPQAAAARYASALGLRGKDRNERRAERKDD